MMALPLIDHVTQYFVQYLQPEARNRGDGGWNDVRMGETVSRTRLTRLCSLTRAAFAAVEFDLARSPRSRLEAPKESRTKVVRKAKRETVHTYVHIPSIP